MRALVFALIFANLLFFTWSQGYLGKSTSADAQRMDQQLLADKIVTIAKDNPPLAKVVAPDPAPVEEETKPETPPKPAVAEVPKPQPVCLTVASLSVEEADRLETELTKKVPNAKIERNVTASHSSYWVNIPPQPSKKDADKKAAELKELGITDFFIVQDNSKNNLAISLGVFNAKAGANTQLASLKAKGVRSAVITERFDKPVSVALQVGLLDNKKNVLVNAAKEIAPGAKDPVPCKNRIASH